MKGPVIGCVVVGSLSYDVTPKKGWSFVLSEEGSAEMAMIEIEELPAVQVSKEPESLSPL